MKILMMTNTYKPISGGVERSIESFTREFRRKGHDVLIAAPEFDDQPENEEEVIRLPALQNFNGTDFAVNLPLPGDLSEVMKNFSADIIHSHHPFLMGDIALRMGGQYNIPVVFTYHTMFEDYIHYLPVHNGFIRKFVVELAAGYANLVRQVIVPSESVKKVLLNREVETPIEVIPTGIFIKEFAEGDGKKVRSQYSIPEESFLIGHVGRLAKEKNLIFLAQCLVKVIKDRKNVHCLIVGDGPSRKEVDKIFNAAGVAERAHFTGLLHGQDLIDAYHAMDLFVFSSTSETQGLVLTEAMVCGTPVVGIDSAGVREVIKDQQNGRLVNKVDEQSFLEALQWCLDMEEDDYSALREEAKKTAADFSMDTCSDKMLKVYEQVLKQEFKHARHHQTWYQLMSRLKTEWKLLKNITEAGEEALSETLK